jgi:hypothetical protein
MEKTCSYSESEGKKLNGGYRLKMEAHIVEITFRLGESIRCGT